jgi:transmembrane sensor
MPATDSNFQRVAKLIRDHQLDELDASSRKELTAWLAESAENQVMFDQLNQPEALNAELAKMTRFNSESSFSAFERKYLKAESEGVLNRPSYMNWRYFYAVAAAIALAVFGLVFFMFAHKEKRNLYATEIGPGTTGATLTLANGKKIKLSDVKSGELAKEAGVTINKSATGQLVYEIESLAAADDQVNTLSTTNGETYQLRLPDGSRIWLNATSSLRYAPNLMQNGRRVVQLDGEAYFEVAHDKKHPFIVESRGQSVEVLGTHFNVNAYKDESQIATTLLEGSVKVTVKGKAQLIKPGQQALNKGGLLQVNEVNPEDITDWKEGDFFLNHVDFKTAMRKIARWYDVEIVYDVPVPEDLESGGWMSRRNNLYTVLKAIEGTGLAKFRLEGKKVHVYR